MNNYQDELLKMKEEIEEKLEKLKEIDTAMKQQEKSLNHVADSIVNNIGDIIEKDKFVTFFKKPYAIIPFNKSYLVVVPKFIKDFQVGWLERETDTHYVYKLDKYSSWLSDIPKEIQDQIDFKKELDVIVDGNQIQFNPSQKELVREKLKGHIKNLKENSGEITKGHEFNVIREIIESGCLPFKPKPVLQSDIRVKSSKIELRDYQQEVIDKFMKTGAVGVFHPTGAGKSIITLYLLDVVKGNKLIVVPSRTLAEQWTNYIEMYIPHYKNEIDIVTYQGFRETDKEYSLLIPDECHRLPANSFSRIASVRTKYRLGLSASPYREDGRTDYIFALTGFPVGLNWKIYMEKVKKSYHPIYVHTVEGARIDLEKIKKIRELLNYNKKTIIFCDSIELGRKISIEFNVPHIHGDTKERIDMINQNNVIVMSRVGDEGVSIKNLQRIIEVDFLFGSRGQQLQRTGRLLHSENAERHDIVMTEHELKDYGKRLWGLQEKGFTIKVVQ